MDRVVLEALNALDVSTMTRAEWLAVGMALKDAGADCSVWDEWSQADTRYKYGECSRLWAGFHGSAKPVTGGTIIQMARDRGWVQDVSSHNYDWNDVIENDGEYVPELPKVEQTPREQLILFLKALFKSDEKIDIVTDEAFKDSDGKWKPRAGHAMSVEQMLKDLDHYRGADAVENTIGRTFADAGAWVRINPMDGNGHGNANVTAYRYALVESDEMERNLQKLKLEQMQLPIATLVDSGGKSLHALVRIDAPDAEEYRKRVDYLYEYLKAHGYTVDEQNKNPARLSRLPSVQRGGEMQRLIATDMGKGTWDAWKAFAEGHEQKLPPILPLGAYIDVPPVLKKELIQGVLRRGHKLMLGGASKAGKSFALMEMCVALASGGEWLGWKCEQARSIYINMELDDQSCGDRLLRIARRMHVNPDDIRNDLYIWNLRGHTMSLDDMMADLLHMMRDIKPSMVVFDPIYKILTGDENNASDMGHFVGQFDKISTELQTSIGIGHHHSKGAQGGKTAMDRVSGSGVFARDPDAIIDMSELIMTDEFLREHPHLNGKRPFRVSTELREFMSQPPRDIWFDYPVHEVDREHELSKLHIAGESLSPAEWGAERGKRFKSDRDNKLDNAYEYAFSHKVQDMADYMGIARSTLHHKIADNECDYFIENGVVYRKDER